MKTPRFAKDFEPCERSEVLPLHGCHVRLRPCRLGILSTALRPISLLVALVLGIPAFAESLPTNAVGVVIYKVRGWGGPSDTALMPFVSIEKTPSITRLVDQHGNKKEIFGGSDPIVLYSPASMEPNAETQIGQIENALKAYPQFKGTLNSMLEGWHRHKAKVDELSKANPADEKRSRYLLLADGSQMRNVTISSVDPDGVKVASETGIVKIPFEKLPPSVQKEFGYDASKAEDFRRERQERAVREVGQEHQMSGSMVGKAERQMPEEGAVPGKAKASPDAIARAVPTTDEYLAGAEVVEGKLPMQFDQDKVYAVVGLFPLQNLDDGWLADLVPPIMAQAFPKQKDETGMLFQTAFNEYVRQGLYRPGLQPVLIVPADIEAFQAVNIPAKSTLLSIRGKFVRFHTYETAGGTSARAPVFVAEKLKLWTGEIIDLSGRK